MANSENYPKQYEDWLTVKNGKIFVRPIALTDEKLVVDFFDKLSPETIYLRFLSQFRALPEFLLNRFTHVNYKSEFALVAIIKEDDGKEAIAAIARYGCLPEEKITDFGITVRDDWQHVGIGQALLKKLFDIGKENGIFRFEGTIHPDNEIMVKTLSKLGYEMKYSIESGFLKVEITV